MRKTLQSVRPRRAPHPHSLSSTTLAARQNFVGSEASHVNIWGSIVSTVKPYEVYRPGQTALAPPSITKPLARRL